MNMKTDKSMKTHQPRLLASALALAIAGLATTSVQAVEFQNGEWSGSIDTTVSYGASWRTTDSKPEDVGKAVAAIAEDLFPFSTGEIFNVDGGFHISRL